MRYLLGFLIVCAVSLGGIAGELREHDGFSFTTIDWADDVLGYQDYIPNPEGVFSRSSRAYAYMEISGFAYDTTEAGYASHLTVSVSLHSASGRRLFRQNDLVDYDAVDKTPPDTIWFYIWVDIPWWTPHGDYTASVLVRDMIGEQEIQHDERLTIR